MSKLRRSLEDLEQTDAFVGRHIGPRPQDQQAMLRTLGLQSMEELVAKVIPSAIRSQASEILGDGCSEDEALHRLRAIADRNETYKSFIGLGYYDCHTPAVILRNVLENPAWYTSYTPYQAEISQGRLEAILNFQTMVSELTGMDLANSSMLDEATAAAEAMTLCRRTAKSKADAFFVSAECHPQTIAVVRTRARPLGIGIVVGDHRRDLDEGAVFGALVQYPATNGEIYDYADVVERCHANQALVVVAADLLSLTLLTPPGGFGADVAVGSTQRFGVPLGYGGPHAAYLATKDVHKRAIPGRLVGVSVDSHGNTAYRMALQTREQHIRREKATSNICTAQALLAVMAGLYAVYHGPEGLRTIARRVHRLTAILADGLGRLGFGVPTEACFDTILVRTGDRTAAIHDAARRRRMNLRPVDDGTIGLALDETTTREDVAALWAVFAGEGAGDGAPSLSVAELDGTAADRLPDALRRSGDILTHPVFHLYRSETEMLRYLRRLADKDLALDRSMIPLGSCTMKLNATTELMPITWEPFNGLHPFAPLEQAQGYRRLIDDLERMLCAVTGYDAVSLQPNAGSQGEYAGLLAIRAYHESRGEGHRDVCLIPSSAHGTNPASAQMAGLKVVVVGCDEGGNVDVEDLRAKAAQHRDGLAALMVTYPSTHGVFEDAITEICDIVHEHGGQVYIDGANMNAMVGLCAPGTFGGDVSHLNLHKTFCIPHGGGGPGVGPIGVRAHLAPFLPGYPVVDAAEAPATVGPVAAAPWGSASILPVSWAYMTMMGRQGLTQASAVAILNANYIASRLSDHYPVLYKGSNGMVAHECIIDLRPIKEAVGLSVDDVAKRLIDYGFHAPTMSFPVAGTMMIEPTESESKEELDRFIEAMIRIRGEIRAVEGGTFAHDDNPLRNAPHTAAALTADKWSHPYTRTQAAFPVAALRDGKYWPPVGRVDNGYGDRHLVCTCPPLSAYQEVA